GHLIVGTVDRVSPLGQMYEANKDTDTFYRYAHFHAAGEIVADIQQAGFTHIEARQTIIGVPGPAAGTTDVQIGFDAEAFEVHKGQGRGAFVALRARKGMRDEG
ncbi:MAG: hypothetical protein JXB30_12775, partial [Anaerolineae bacterium]|nr:hypothetical protein [Anaerolineae bacterium]